MRKVSRENPGRVDFPPGTGASRAPRCPRRRRREGGRFPTGASEAPGPTGAQRGLLSGNPLEIGKGFSRVSEMRSVTFSKQVLALTSEKDEYSIHLFDISIHVILDCVGNARLIHWL